MKGGWWRFDLMGCCATAHGKISRLQKEGSTVDIQDDDTQVITNRWSVQTEAFEDAEVGFGFVSKMGHEWRAYLAPVERHRMPFMGIYNSRELAKAALDAAADQIRADQRRASHR